MNTASSGSDYFYLSFSSDGATVSAPDLETQHSNFTVALSEPVVFREPQDVALVSCTINAGNQQGVDASTNVDAFITCSLAQATVRVNDVKLPVLRRVTLSSANVRETKTFGAPLRFVPCALTTFSKISVKILTDSFRKQGKVQTLLPLQDPASANPTSITLAFRRRVEVSGDRVGEGGGRV